MQTSPDVLAARPERAQADVRAAVEAIAAVSSKIPTDANDPWRGQFGGSAVAGGYRLSAEVKRSNVPNFFSIKLLVSRVGEATAREAEFFLHPTFPNPRVERKMNKFGNATLSLLAWGAFTVGVRLDNGVELELDLSEVQDAPEVFRNR